jgi:hypothetical protein
MARLKGLTFFLQTFLFLPGFLFFLAAAQQDPTHSITPFHNPPSRLFFFDDSQAVIYHDGMGGDVYVSQDEGKSWARAEDIPKGIAMMVIEHPFDNQYAFVLTDGLTHYRTTDRGKSWQSFKMPVEPAFMSKPLSFHSDKTKYGFILYQGTKCHSTGGWGTTCVDVTYYTKEAFGDEPELLLEDTSRCQFAHSSTDFKHDAHSDLIYCVAFDPSMRSPTTGLPSFESSRLYSSPDFFKDKKKVEDLGIGKNAKGIVAFAIVSKFAVVALRDLSPKSRGEMLLYVTIDTETWAKAQFPHASSATLRENAYTLVESTTHSLAVDVVLQDYSAIGTLFVSNSNGTFFVESLKDTNRNDVGYVDYERIYGVEGVGLANTVSNAQDVEGRGAQKKVKTFITFDDGSNWLPVRPPSEDSDGRKISCDRSDPDKCSLHLHSVTDLNNYGRVFSAPAPGLVMGIGSIGESLLVYEECDTFLSTDAGVSWIMVKRDAHKHQIGGLGSYLVVVNDEEGVDELSYSLDFGKSWRTYKLDIKMRARGLTTLADSTSQKFLLLGQVAKKDRKDDRERVVVVQIDFTDVLPRKCSDGDFEKWYARRADAGCLMGHKQWYNRRKPDANCYVAEKFQDPVGHEDNCECTDADYECDYNYIRQGSKCIPAGPERIPANVCKNPEDTYSGSSGYRKIPGNTCRGGIEKDKPVPKKCSDAQPEEGSVTHQLFEFPGQIVQYEYFNQSKTILVRLMDHSMWQSSNEGYTWTRLFPEERFLVFYRHKYSSDRAYLLTDSKKFFITTNAGQKWEERKAPTIPNGFSVQVMRFHPDSDKLLWIGMENCGGRETNCRVVVHYSRNNGDRWTHVEDYVRNCAWVRDHNLDADPNEILCESFRDKKGNQQFFRDNALELVTGADYYKRKKKVFDHVAGFAKFSEYLVVAELIPERSSLDLQVSVDGVNFAAGQFPPSIRPEAHAYTVLESSTGSLFFHMTMSEPPAPYWGTILKSNSNGTYFGIALENVNRDDRGYVDFEKMIGLDGIALVNVVSNPHEAALSGQKLLQTRITHNDGSTWKPLKPPKLDSLGKEYDCTSAQKCALHIHGYTERTDPRATFSSPSVVGLLMAVGNVGESLAPYDQCDTFLSRDAGFTWEEVHKDAHLWEFGDSGSILVIANDEEPTDSVLFSKDEGKSWREYKFGQEKIRVRSIVTVPSDTSRRFILIGNYPRSSTSVAVHLDFSALTMTRCKVSLDEPGKDDFELWSPSEERQEVCLFGRKVLYHRRRRDVDCVVGDQRKAAEQLVENCACAAEDFECEFNYVKNDADECVLVPGTTPLPSDETCSYGQEYWYERTAYRKIPYSSCDGGDDRHLGMKHECPGYKARGALFWMFIIMIPFAFTALVAYYYYRRRELSHGTIRLPSEGRMPHYGDSGALDTLASVPWYLFGLASIAWEWLAERFDHVAMRSRQGYRNVPIDEDAQILRFEDEEI